MHSSWLSSTASFVFIVNVCLLSDAKAETYKKTNDNIVINSKHNIEANKSVKDYKLQLRKSSTADAGVDADARTSGRELQNTFPPVGDTTVMTFPPGTNFGNLFGGNHTGMQHNFTYTPPDFNFTPPDFNYTLPPPTTIGFGDLVNQVGQENGGGNIDFNAFLQNNNEEMMNDAFGNMGGQFNMSLGDSNMTGFDPDKLMALLNDKNNSNGGGIPFDFGNGGGIPFDFGGGGAGNTSLGMGDGGMGIGNFSSFKPWKLCCSQYVAPETVIGYQSISRMGHSNDLDQAILTGEYDDYVEGLFAGPRALMSLFAIWQIWIIIIWAIKCCGCTCCGFLSGTNMAEGENEENGGKILLVRIIFGISCFALIHYLSTFITEGVNGMQKSIEILYWATSNLKNITTVNANHMQNISTHSAYAQSTFQNKSMATVLQTLCPTRLDIQMKAMEFNLYMGIWTETVSGGGVEMIQNAGMALQQLRNVTDSAEDVILLISETFIPLASLYYAPLMAMTVLLLLTCLAKLCRCTSSCWDCFIAYGILPFFQWYIFISWLWAGVLFALAMANADVCYGGDQHSPEGTIESIFKRQGISENSTDVQYQLAHSTAMYYIGCNASFPFSMLGILGSFTNSTAEGGQGLIDMISDQLSVSQRYLQAADEAASNALVEDSCVTEAEYSDIQTIVVVMKILLKLMTELVKYLSCDIVGPVYDELVNTGLCTYTPDALAHAVKSLMGTSVCGLMMLAMRSALYDTTKE